jgi:hypothetical protein
MTVVYLPMETNCDICGTPRTSKVTLAYFDGQAICWRCYWNIPQDIRLAHEQEWMIAHDEP